MDPFLFGFTNLKIKQTLDLLSSYTLNRKQIVNTKKEQHDERHINSTFTEMARMALEYCINSLFIFDRLPD